MNDYFRKFVTGARAVAERAGLPWEMPLDADGFALDGLGWDLSALVSEPPPRALLRDLGFDDGCLKYLNTRNAGPPQVKRPLSPGWQDLLKSAAIDQVLIRRNRPLGANNNVVRPLRVLATCAQDAEPWEISREHVEQAREIGAALQASGKLSDLVTGVVRDVIDRNHLGDNSPLLPVSSFQRHQPRNPLLGTSPVLRRNLEDRARADRLPDPRALWELVRIVLTESPQTYLDVIRFAQAKLMLLCGFRIGEATMVPLDWRRDREYFDMDGRPAGSAGGISKSMGIRHFAEKKRGLTTDAVALYETVQHVPAMFEEIIAPTLEQVERITAPLRKRLRAQTETGRIFPEYEPEQLMPAVEFFVRLFGTVQLHEEALPAAAVAKYTESWDPALLDAIRAAQARSDTPLRIGAKTAWSKLNERAPLPVALRSDGRPWVGRQSVPWSRSFFRVADLERYVPEAMPTKLPDRTPHRLGNGSPLYPHDLLFIGPKRALLEERNDRLCDLGLYFSLGHVSPVDLILYLGGREGSNFFTRYGQTEEDRGLSLLSHSLRHLQTTELYSLGISELFMMKRFNRRSIMENRQYKHLTLAEDLNAVDLPRGAEENLGDKAQEVLRLISAGKLAGPIVDEFRRIQREQGDAAAFSFLQVEADGFHATPYGFCITSFLGNSCPRHLECFAGCRHLTLSPVEEHKNNLLAMRDQLQATITAIMDRPEGHPAREQQLTHARVRLANVERAIGAAPGTKPFADGPDRWTRVAGGSQ